MAHEDYREELTVHPDDHPHAYDRREPNYTFLTLFSVTAVVLFVLTVAGVTLYYRLYSDNTTYEKVLAPPSQELKAVRDREDRELHTYHSIDKAQGKVRIPIDRAMELLVKESAENRLKYSTEPYSIAAAAARAQAVQDGARQGGPAENQSMSSGQTGGAGGQSNISPPKPTTPTGGAAPK
jgi:hypothetical protein